MEIERMTVKKMKKSSFRIGQFWAGPSALLLLALTIVPLCMLVIFGFMDGNLLAGQPFPGWTLNNFKDIFSTDTFGHLLGKSLVMGFIITLICIVIAYPAAWTIAKVVKEKNRNMLMMMVILPFFTSQLLLIYAMMMLVQSGGLVMTVLSSLHLADAETSILYTNAATVLVLVYEYLPYMILCLYSSLEGISDNLIHASLTLGAGKWNTFKNVVFPMSIPGLLSGILLVLIPACGSFAEPSLVGGPNGMMVGSLINSQYNSVLNMGYGAALSCILLIVLSVIMAVIRFCVNRAERKIGGEIS